MAETTTDLRLADDGAAIGIRECGYFHGPDGECTYERFVPEHYQIRECGECGHRWNFPTPADRCPREYDHEYDDEAPKPGFATLPAEGDDFSGYPAGADPVNQPCDDCGARPGEKCRPHCIGEAASHEELDALVREIAKLSRYTDAAEILDAMPELISRAVALVGMPPAQRCLNCGAREGEDCQSWCAYKPEGRPIPSEVDTTSSASRQHYIDTGRYLRPGEAEEI